jgi:hypothetical protein
MNTRSEKKGSGRTFVPSWLREEWVWQGLLVILMTPAIVHAVLSIGGGNIA